MLQPTNCCSQLIVATSYVQCVAVCCSVLQCVAVCCSALQFVAVRCSALQCVAVRCSALQCIAVRCSALQCVVASIRNRGYGVATISRLLKMIGVFCKRTLWKRRYSAEETYHFKAPTHRSHLIPDTSYGSWIFTGRASNIHGRTKSLFVLQKPDSIFQFPFNNRSAHTQRHKERSEKIWQERMRKTNKLPLVASEGRRHTPRRK